ARLGRRAINLAVPGGLPSTSYFLLERTLASGVRPSAILVDYKPNHLQTRARDYARQLAAFASPGECLDLAWSARDAVLPAMLSLAKYLPSYRYRHTARVAVLIALRGAPTKPRWLLP